MAHDAVRELQRGQNRRLLDKRLLQGGSAQPAKVCANEIECAIFELKYRDRVGRLCNGRLCKYTKTTTGPAQETCSFADLLPG
jgi:hypothetical protein